MLLDMDDEDMESLWPKIINFEPQVMTLEKQTDLYEHGRHMSRDANKSDFLHMYPKPNA